MASTDATLAAWAPFPVDVSPRPVVFLDSRMRFGDGGFVDEPAKQAFLAGAVEADLALPDGVLQFLTPERRRTSQSPLRITAVAQVAASFRTDRGMRECPGYELTITGLRQPCLVLDPEQSFWWPRTAQQWADAPTGQFARIEADGRTMHVVAHGGYWTEFLGVDFVETPAAVLAQPRIRDRRPAGITAVPLVLVEGRVTGTLQAPLGHRVLLDERGVPASVVPVDAGAGHLIEYA
jgi:hypothetical protein